MLLTVWMGAYNHESFIAKAIEGVLMQQTDFDVEIVIGEDCSTDSTRRIILDYNDKYPGKFKLLLPNENMGIIPMFKATYPMCTGKYVAWLEGDDYWTDQLKLQKQVDFLEAHTDFVMCFHNVSILDQIQHTTYIKDPPKYMNPNGSLSVSHFCFYNPVATSSVVYRNILPEVLPSWFYEVLYPDLAFYFLLVEKGRIQYINDVMGVYRIHRDGEWSGKSKYTNFLQLSQFYKKIGSVFSGKYKKLINKNSTWYTNELLMASLEENEFTTARQCLKNILMHDPGYIKLNKSRFFKLGLWLYLGIRPKM